MRKVLTSLAKLLGLLLLALVLVVAYQYTDFRRERLAQLESTRHVVDTAAGPVEYSLVGDAGPVILFLHGTPGGFDANPFFKGDIPGYRRLTPSRPGYLGTPLSVGVTPEDQARACAALLDALGIDSVIVRGASGGGPAALTFAARYPGRTRAVVGLEILSYANAEPLQIPGLMTSDFWYWLGLSLVDGLDDGRVLLGMFQLPATDTEAVLASADGLERMQAMVWAGWPAATRVAGWENDSTQFLSLDLPLEAVRAPTLLLQGTADIQVSWQRTRDMVARMPDATLYKVENGTHAMPLTHRDELVEAITAFLRDVGASAPGNSG